MTPSPGFLENFKVMKRLKKSRWNNLEDMTYEEELERNEVDSDLESTASRKPKHVDLEDTCKSGSRPNPNLAEDVPDYPFKSKLRYA
ncbi:hypothetical protein Tco_0863200 [Tanacetum coccineum]